VSEAAGLLAADVSALVAGLPPRDSAALARIVSRLLVVHAADRGVNLFAAAAR